MFRGFFQLVNLLGQNIESKTKETILLRISWYIWPDIFYNTY